MKLPDRETIELDNPMQRWVDGMNANWQAERSETQMTLGKMIAALETLPSARAIVGLGTLDSYRGYYDDLAFEPNDRPWTVGELLAECRSAMGRTFQGYKGGDYVMWENTPLHVASYGRCGDALIGLDTNADPIVPITKRDDEVRQ